jgi:phosphoglycolate phosphatase
MKLILFDFDGVLVDTLMMHYKISKEVNKGMSLDFFRSFQSENLYVALKKNPETKMHPKFFERYEEESRELKIPVSIKNIFHKLNKKDYIFAIVSSTPSNLVAKILKQAGAFEYFVDVLGGDFDNSKIVKNKILLKKYKILSKDAVYITDTVGDIIEARECGIASIAVTWGFQEKKTLQKEKPFALVDTPQELEEKIEEFFK